MKDLFNKYIALHLRRQSLYSDRADCCLLSDLNQRDRTNDESIEYQETTSGRLHAAIIPDHLLHDDDVGNFVNLSKPRLLD